MEEYGVRWDSDGRYYVVVKWDNPQKQVTGSIVHRAKREADARDWIQQKLTEIDKK